LLTLAKFQEILNDKKAKQVDEVKKWALSFGKGFWLGNAAKTLSDVSILPSKVQKG